MEGGGRGGSERPATVGLRKLKTASERERVGDLICSPSEAVLLKTGKPASDWLTAAHAVASSLCVERGREGGRFPPYSFLMSHAARIVRG